MNTIWDETEGGLTSDTNGLSYVSVLDEGGDFLTSSITEAHRINSPYILENKDTTFLEAFKSFRK